MEAESNGFATTAENATAPVCHGCEAATDFFAFAFSDDDHTSYFMLVGTWLLVQLVGMPLVCGKISYELYGSLNYQTLVNKLNLYLHVMGVFYNLTGFNVLCARVFGPLPRIICAAQVIEVASFACTAGIISIESTTLRYLYTCVWNHVGMLDDDFFGRFFLWANSLATLFFAAVVAFSGDYYGVKLAYCEGRDPSVILGQPTVFPKSVRLSLAIPAFSALSCASVLLLMYARLVRKNGQDANKYRQIRDMFGLGKVIHGLMALLLGLSILPHFYVGYLVRAGNLSSSSAWPHLVTFAMLADHVVVLAVLPLSFYCFDGKLRRHVGRAVRDSCLGQSSPWRAGEHLVRTLRSNLVSPAPPTSQQQRQKQQPQQQQQQQQEMGLVETCGRRPSTRGNK